MVESLCVLYGVAGKDNKDRDTKLHNSMSFNGTQGTPLKQWARKIDSNVYPESRKPCEAVAVRTVHGQISEFEFQITRQPLLYALHGVGSRRKATSGNPQPYVHPVSGRILGQHEAPIYSRSNMSSLEIHCLLNLSTMGEHQQPPEESRFGIDRVDGCNIHQSVG